MDHIDNILEKHTIVIDCSICGSLIEGYTWDDIFECPLCGSRMDHLNFDSINFYNTEERNYE